MPSDAAADSAVVMLTAVVWLDTINVPAMEPLLLVDEEPNAYLGSVGLRTGDVICTNSSGWES